MESPRKFNDCYFYYYSTCTKGDNCVFRHEPSALGCEIMCTEWQEGKCLDKQCKLRHMELRKNRKQIPCYWENQPGGCRKKHCPFMHKNPEARTDGIAPSQPTPHAPAVQQVSAMPEPILNEPHQMPAGLPPNVAPPQPVPLLWQQQRQVLESAILGVVPGAGPRREAYAVPLDPLVVNFDEESDNESTPSSTPTKNNDEAHIIARSKSQELLLLEKIQAEAAAFYSYDSLSLEKKDRKIVRKNLCTKYDKSLDQLAGKKTATTEARSSHDFKVLSLDEIRAKKKSDSIVHSTPITLNLRKRKLSTQESVTTSGNKIIKVVRSNCIVYKKLDPNASTSTGNKAEQKQKEDSMLKRKRTFSEQSDISEVRDDELIDNIYEFKKVKVAELTNKPKLIRNRLVSETKADIEKIEDLVYNTQDNDSEEEVQIVCEETVVIDLEAAKTSEPIDIVDLSDDDDVTVSSVEIDLSKNVPDVVASCKKSSSKSKSDAELMREIDDLLDDDL